MKLAVREELRGVYYMLAAAFIFSIMIVSGKAAAKTLPPMEVVFSRGVFVLIAILPAHLRNGRSVLGRRPKTLFLRSIFGFAALALLMNAIVAIPAASATVLNLTSILFTAVLAVPVLKEKLTPERALFSVLGFLGILLILKPSWEVVDRHLLLALGSGILSSFSYLTIRSLKGGESAELVVLHFGAYCGVLSCLFFGRSFLMPNLQEFLLLSVTAASGCYAQLLMTAAYSYAPAAKVAPFLYTEVPLVALWAFLFTNEVPDLLTIAGSLCVVAAGVGIIRERPQPTAE